MTELHPDLAEGDAFLHNDPYLGNTHSADHAILVPVFVDGRARVHRVREGPPGRLRERAADHLHAGRARRLRGGRADLPVRPGAARSPRHRRHHPHVPAADPRAGPVVRRLPRDARRGADRRAAARRSCAASTACQTIRALHPRVVRLQRAADGRGDRPAAGRRAGRTRHATTRIRASPTASRCRSKVHDRPRRTARSSSTCATTRTTTPAA